MFKDMKKSWTIFLIDIIFLLFFSILTPVLAGNPPDQGKSTISGTAAPADGLTSSTVTIVLKDVNGNTLSSRDSIAITSSNTSTSFNPSSVTLDGSGIIRTQMKSSFVGSVPVTVTDNSTGNTQITGYVAFYQPGTDPPAPGACKDPAPGGTATLVSAVSNDDHSITLTWTLATNPVTYYLLSYGISPGNYIYGVPNVGGQGATSFTVGGLTTGKKYYFVVRPGNGCTPGTFSNELAAVAGKTLTPTPKPVETLMDTSNKLDSTPTITPAVLTDIETPTPRETQAVAPVLISTTDSFISRFMIGATALGVICAIFGGLFYLRMKK